MINLDTLIKSDAVVESNGSKVDESGPRSCPKELTGKVQLLVDLICSTTGLDEHQARTVVYFAISTYGLPDLEKFPLLVILGPAGTGKTTLLEILRQIAYRTCPYLIDGKSTNAVLRNTLANLQAQTALIDEADDAAEKWLLKRYDRKSSGIDINHSAENGWEMKNSDLFGATALHRRKPFKDPAILSRSIVISTKKSKVVPYSPGQFSGFASVLEDIADSVDWTLVPEHGGDRIKDTWAPLLEVDERFIGDWRTFADGKIRTAQKNLDLGHEIEPGQAVYKAFLYLALCDGSSVAERVLLGSIKNLAAEEESLSSYQVGWVLSELGFEKRNAGGQTFIYTGGKDRLVEVGINLGIQDDWLDEVAASGHES